MPHPAEVVFRWRAAVPRPRRGDARAANTRHKGLKDGRASRFHAPPVPAHYANLPQSRRDDSEGIIQVHSTVQNN